MECVEEDPLSGRGVLPSPVETIWGVTGDEDGTKVTCNMT